MKNLGRIFGQRVLTSMLILISISLLIGSVVERVDAEQIGIPANFTGGSSIAAENKQLNNAGISCANTVSYVSGHKFDNNNNPLGGWTIHLFGIDRCNGDPLTHIVNMVTTTSSSDGSYQFPVPNIPASSARYWIREDLKPGWVPCCGAMLFHSILPTPGLPGVPGISIYDFRNRQIW